jgi:hypothetical protein
MYARSEARAGVRMQGVRAPERCGQRKAAHNYPAGAGVLGRPRFCACRASRRSALILIEPCEAERAGEMQLGINL